MAKVLSVDASGNTIEISGKASSAGSADAGALVQLDANGKIDITQLPNNIGADAISIVASEALAAGAFVNIYNNSGTANVRNASASAIGMQAHGYVNAAVASSGSATVYFDDSNTGVTGQTAGTAVFLSATTPGATTTTPPTTAGQILQKLGVATTASSIHVNIEKPIIRA